MLLTGVDNLDDIHHLEMKVNTSDTSLGNFGQLLQNLKQLKVSNSIIPRIRYAHIGSYTPGATGFESIVLALCLSMYLSSASKLVETFDIHKIQHSYFLYVLCPMTRSC